jgi:hypothetical protein
MFSAFRDYSAKNIVINFMGKQYTNGKTNIGTVSNFDSLAYLKAAGTQARKIYQAVASIPTASVPERTQRPLPFLFLVRFFFGQAKKKMNIWFYK